MNAVGAQTEDIKALLSATINIALGSNHCVKIVATQGMLCQW